MEPNQQNKQASNITRDIEIEKKLTVIIEEGIGHNRGKKGKGRQRTCTKDPWTKSEVGRIEGGRWGKVGWKKVVVGKWRQLYLNINLKNDKKK